MQSKFTKVFTCRGGEEVTRQSFGDRRRKWRRRRLELGSSGGCCRMVSRSVCMKCWKGSGYVRSTAANVDHDFDVDHNGNSKMLSYHLHLHLCESLRLSSVRPKHQACDAVEACMLDQGQLQAACCCCCCPVTRR